MTENKGSKVMFVRKAEQVASKQPEDQTFKGAIDPPVTFYSLEKAYEGSFILGGIFDKLSAAGDSGFKVTGNAELDRILKELDMKNVFENLLVYGNVFIEKIADGRGMVKDLEKILTSTMSVWQLGTERGYVQRISGQRAFFLPEEILHSKLGSVTSKYYGNSKFSKAVQQIVLLSQIDSYYGKDFDRGMLGVNLLTDVGDANGKKLSEDNAAALGAWLEDNAGGSSNAFVTAIIPTKLEKIDLEKNVDPEAFLKYRSDLIESIAIALNIPADLLSSKNSNRSTSEVAYAMLNELIVKPMQDGFLADLKEALRETFQAAVDLIEMNPVDDEDDEKEMKVLTGYKRSGVLTANEVREKLGYEKHVDGDKLVVDTSKDPAQTPEQVAKEIQDIQKSIASMYEPKV